MNAEFGECFELVQKQKCFKIKVVYTCGLCEVIVDEINHPCNEGYGHIYIDNNFYPVLDDGETIIRRFQLDDHTEGVVEDELETNENMCPNKLIAMGKICELKFELLEHPPYSPDLVPSDYHLFPPKTSQQRGGH
ncbi:hypothetical protein NQ318_018193 [Aromia moschata]|uniref:Uncharacterized protein n=1 Tax=Aromia moschata TaxID=1265417 RepID=A0AAV8ZDC2_9CUCU|nr:hypothetical protein NQ318_018193 [Aromia moschata]